ncbi:hypothetical protein BDW66DRAFT_154245 [Aspergillus desertorum]
MKIKQELTGWNACPPELLHLIAKLLSFCEHRALCHFTWQKCRKYYATPEQPPPIIGFLRTLFSRPQLACYVTSLHLDGNAHFLDAYRRKLPKLSIPEDEFDGLIRFIQSTGVPNSDRWIQSLRDGSIDAVVALLLSRLPSLKALYLGRPFTRETALIGTVLRSAICEPTYHSLPNFHHLQDVTFLRSRSRDQACDRKVKNTADLLPFFYLHNFQPMSAAIQNPDTWTWPAAHLPTPSNLTLLDLTCIREAYLGDVLAVTKNLETLRWDWYYDGGVEDDFTTQTIKLDQISAAISRARATLTELTITADCSRAAGDQFYPAVETHGLMKAMVDFGMIKRLQIPLAFLVGFAQDTTKRLEDVVPRNIEFLTITDDLALQNEDHLEEEWRMWEWKDYAIMDLPDAWLKGGHAHTPHLCRVTLLLKWIDSDTDQWSPAARDRLRDLSTQVGIPVDLVDLTRRRL